MLVTERQAPDLRFWGPKVFRDPEIVNRDSRDLARLNLSSPPFWARAPGEPLPLVPCVFPIPLKKPRAKRRQPRGYCPPCLDKSSPPKSHSDRKTEQSPADLGNDPPAASCSACRC